MPKVSIIIPCHNKDTYLFACLHSVLNQSLTDIEVLAIDDHSTDNTLQILKFFQKEYPSKLKVFSLDEKTGVSAARNLGLENAQGEYISFVDADDIISLNMCQDYYQKAKEHNVSLVTGSFQRISFWEYQTKAEFVGIDVYREKYVDYINSPFSFFDECAACWGKLYSHDLIGNSKFLENHIFEDTGFVYPILLKAKIGYEFVRDDYLYRDTPGGIMDKLKLPNSKIFDMLGICLDMKKSSLINHFDKKQKELIEDCIKERILSTFFMIEHWNISSMDKQMILKKIIAIYRYYFPNLFKFHTIQAEFIYQDLRNAFKSYKTPKILFQKDVNSCREEVLKLVKSLENSSHS